MEKKPTPERSSPFMPRHRDQNFDHTEYQSPSEWFTSLTGTTKDAPDSKNRKKDLSPLDDLQKACEAFDQTRQLCEIRTEADSTSVRRRIATIRGNKNSWLSVKEMLLKEPNFEWLAKK